MGKIIMNLPGNTGHSNVKRWTEMDEQKLGLYEIGKTGIPVTVSFQAIDFEILPWLGDVIKRYPSIELINATKAHGLTPLMPESMQGFETEKIIGTVPVTFFPEFYNPEKDFIPTEFFWLLDSQSHLYSSLGQQDQLSEDDFETSKIPSDAFALNYEGKIGIIMRESFYKPILDAFFRFQRDPVTADIGTDNKDPLQFLLDKVEAVGNMSDETVVVVPIDIEAPFVGSALGAKAWQLFFEGIKERGLERIFVSANSQLDFFRDNAVESARPHRALGKWTAHEVQIKHMLKLKALPVQTKREKMLYSIAFMSDLLSAWERKIGDAKRAVVLNGKDLAGNEVKLPVSYSQDIIEVCLAAYRAITDHQTFLQRLESLKNQSLLIQRYVAYAKKYDL